MNEEIVCIVSVTCEEPKRLLSLRNTLDEILMIIKSLQSVLESTASQEKTFKLERAAESERGNASYKGSTP